MNKVFFISLLTLLFTYSLSFTAYSYTEREKAYIVDYHNRLRCQLVLPAQTMPAMVWDNTLEQVAQNYADKCPGYSHNGNRSSDYAQLGGTGYVGENLAWGYYTLKDAINALGNEKYNFLYRGKPCEGQTVCGCVDFYICGHYTQMVWDGTTKVGAAHNPCAHNTYDFYVFNYAPGGNYGGTPPYIPATLPIKTDACKEIEKIPLKFFATLGASSSPERLPNLLDDNDLTYWAPLTGDANPYITIAFTQALNVDLIRLRWSNLNRAAKKVSVEYSLKADGSELNTLPVQTLTQRWTPTIDVNQKGIRYLKINFLEPFDRKVRLTRLNVIDPTLSIAW